MKITMFLPLIIIGAFSQFSEIGYDDWLGSLPVSWPEQWVTALVATDSNHYNTVEELYLYFGVNSQYNLTTGVVEAYIGDETESLDCSLDNYGSEEYNDYIVTCTIAENKFTAAGTYGPIHLVVRQSDSGQIFAEDTAFAYFGLTSEEPTLDENALTVEFYSSDQDFTVSAESTLSFSFSLDADENIYRGDYFILTLDDQFEYEKLSVTLNSSTNAGSFPDEGAFLYTDGNVYLIGLTEDLSGADGANFTFTISGFSNPIVATSANNYEWTLAIWRYGTPTLLKYISGDGPSDAITVGKVSVNSWKPVHANIKTDYFYAGFVTYMTMTLTATHEIPASGKVTIVLKNVTPCSKTHLTDASQDLTPASDPTTDCAIVHDSRFASWAISAIDSSTIVLTVGTSAISAGSSFTVTNLIEVTASPIGFTSVATSSGGSNIDELDSTTFTDITFSGVELEVTNVRIYTSTTSDTGVNTIGTTDTHGFGLFFVAPAALGTGAYTINIYAPVAKDTTTFQETKVGYPASFLSKLATGSAITASSPGTPSDITSKTSISNSAITIANPTIDITDTHKVYIYVFPGNDGTGKIFLPSFVTFLKNTPQIVVTLTSSSNSKTYAYAAPWRIQDTTGLTTVTFNLLCDDLLMNGAPAAITITPPYNLQFDGYTLLVRLDTNLDFTNLDDSVDAVFPVSGADGNVGTLNADDILEFSISKIATTGLSIKLPLPEQKADPDTTVIVKIYAVDSDDVPTLLTTEGSKSAATDAAATPTGTTATLTATETDTSSVSFTGTTTSGIKYNSVIIYDGSQFDFTSPTWTVGTLQILVSTVSATSGSTAFTAAFSNPWYDSETEIIYFAMSEGADYSTDTGCTHDKKTYTYASGTAVTFGTPTYSPKSVNSYTYDAPTTDISFSLPIIGSVYRGAIITISLADSWTDSEDWEVSIGGVVVDGAATAGEWVSEKLTFESTSNPTLLVKIYDLVLPEMVDTDTDVERVGIEQVLITYAKGDDPEWLQSSADSTTKKVITKILGVDNDPFTISDELAWIFPDLKGSEDVYFGIEFSTDIDLVAGDLINIEGSFAIDDDADFNTWCSLGFDAVSVAENTLTLTLSGDLNAGDVITIIKDIAFTPSTAGDITVTVTVTRDDEDIVSDTTTYTVSTASAEVSTFTVEVDNSVPGFPSIHTFTVSLDTALEAGSCLLFDASSDYNIALGEVYTFEDYGDDMFLWAEDGYFYQVKHWVLEYVTSEDYDAETDIVFSVEIQNPLASGSWSVYVTDVNMTFIAYDSLADDLTFTGDLSNDIDVYFATPDFASDSQTHSLAVEALIDLGATAESEFTIAFPAPYNLDFDNSGSITCSLYQDDVQVALSSNECVVEDNMVTFTLNEATTFTPDSWTTFNFEDLVSPKWGFSLDLAVYEYDESEYWTGRFCAFYNEKDKDITSLSLDNLNGAYFGFEVVLLSTFSVNGGETIIVTPGTYSGTFTIVPVNYEDGELSDLEGLLTESVVLTGEVGSYDNEGTIVLSDDGTYTLDFFNPSAEFWVGAAADCPEGMYYIKWSIDETQYDGYDDAYGTYLKTKLQVSAAFTYEVSVDIPDGSSFFIPPGIVSFPYRVSISQEQRTVSPYEAITFTFSVDSENATFTFYPEDGLVINAFETEAYLMASCDGCEDGEVYDVIVTASDNAGAFVFTDFSVTSGSPYEAAPTYDLTVPEDSIVSSGFQVLIENSDSYAVVTWCIISLDLYNETLTSYDYLIDNTFNLGSSDSDAWEFDDFVDDYLSQIDAVFEEYETYEEMAIAILKIARNIFWIGQTLIDDSDSQELYDFTGMLAFESGYSVFVYADNYWGGDVTVKYKDVTTADALKPCALSLSGDINVDSMTIDLSQLLSIPTEQIIFDVSSRRRLGEATVTLITGVTDKKSTKQKVEEVTVDTITNKLGVTVKNLGELSPSDSAEWVDPLWTEVDDGVLEFNFTTSADGNVYCVLEVNSTYSSAYDSDSIRFGLDRNGDDADDSSTLEVLGGNSYTLTFNFTDDGYGVYDVACVACDDYPLTPTCSSVANYTLDYSESSSGAFALVFAAAAYLLI